MTFSLREDCSSLPLITDDNTAVYFHIFISLPCPFFAPVLLLLFYFFKAPDHGVESTPAPHAHWTLYEALQQPMAIARALAFGGGAASSYIS